MYIQVVDKCVTSPFFLFSPSSLFFRSALFTVEDAESIYHECDKMLLYMVFSLPFLWIMRLPSFFFLALVAVLLYSEGACAVNIHALQKQVNRHMKRAHSLMDADFDGMKDE